MIEILAVIQTFELLIATLGLIFSITAALFGYIIKEIKGMQSEIHEMNRENRNSHFKIMSMLGDFQTYLERVERDLDREGIDIPPPSDEINIESDD